VLLKPLKGIIMKAKFTASALALAADLIAGSPAPADISREQFIAELTEAVRTGDIVARGEIGPK
jgi:hypothetical protein